MKSGFLHGDSDPISQIQPPESIVRKYETRWGRGLERRPIGSPKSRRQGRYTSTRLRCSSTRGHEETNPNRARDPNPEEREENRNGRRFFLDMTHPPNRK